MLSEVAQSSVDLMTMFGAGVLLTLIIGFYGVLVSDNLIRTLIGLEILTKGVTLLIILAGYLTGQTALAQALAITLIVIEVAVIVVAVGIVLCLFRHNKTIDANTIRTLKG